MKIFSITSFLVLQVAAVYGLEASHQGFLYGIDIGAGLQTNFTQMIFEGRTYTGSLLADFAISTDFKVGLSKKGNAGFFLASHNEWKKPGVTAMSFNSLLLEIDQFTKPVVPSFHVCYGAGWGWWLYPFDDYSNTWLDANGITSFVGLGYEFGKHFVAEIDLSAGALKHDGSITVTYDYGGGLMYSEQKPYAQWFYVFSLRLTVGYLGYRNN
jgi:hypothetical protein